MTTGDSHTTVYLGLGTNVGDREANLKEAVRRIRGIGLEVARESSIYETEPVGFADQKWFLNQVVAARMRERAIGLGELLCALHDIEREMGRERTILNGPRVIDIDILLVSEVGGREFTSRAAPIIPHPRMHERRFVLEPLCEIAPGLTYPGGGKTVCEMLASLADASAVRLYKRSA